jgi:hypothetical protein
MEQARVVATGVELSLDEEDEGLEPLPPEIERRLPHTPEDRALDGRVESGEMIRVRAQEFVEFDTAEGRQRWGGSSFGTAIDVTADPALALLELARGDVRQDGPFGDLRRGGYDVTRWEYYSAPHRLELSEKLRERLDGAWKERPPRK